MSLADQIIEHEPWSPDALAGLNATGAEMNALRSELLELRLRRQADEDRARFVIRVLSYRSGGGLVFGIDHLACPAKWWDEAEDSTTLAELLRRADEHGEVCG